MHADELPKSQFGGQFRVGRVSSVDASRHSAQVQFFEGDGFVSWDMAVVVNRGGDYWLPTKDTPVLCLLVEGRLGVGFVLGAIYTDSDAPRSTTLASVPSRATTCASARPTRPTRRAGADVQRQRCDAGSSRSSAVSARFRGANTRIPTAAGISSRARSRAADAEGKLRPRRRREGEREMSIGVLGPITFEVNADKVRTWQEAKRSGSARWTTHEVYAGKPKREFIGPGLDRIDLVVRLDATRGVKPKEELQQMREQRDKGNVLQFTVGGELVGDFTIETVDEQWSRVIAGGVLVVAVVNLTLEEYS
jgi:phage protein U